MLAFPPRLLLWLAASSTTIILHTGAMAIPRAEITSPHLGSHESSTSTSGPRFPGHNGSIGVSKGKDGVHRWFFVAHNKRTTEDSTTPPKPAAMPAPPKFAASSNPSSKGKKPKSSKNSTSSPKATSASTSSHNNHAQHVPGQHHRDQKTTSSSGKSKGEKKKHSSKGKKKGKKEHKKGRRQHVQTVVIDGRHGHTYSSNNAPVVLSRSRPDNDRADRLRKSRRSRMASDKTIIYTADAKHSYHLHAAGLNIDIPFTDAASVSNVRPKQYGRRAHELDSRDTISADVPGTLDIKTVFSPAVIQTTLASLVLSANPTTNSSFILSATNLTATPVYLHVEPSTSQPQTSNNSPANASQLKNDAKVVSLRIPVFDRMSASETEYCAQFNPSASAPEPLSAVPCLEGPAPIPTNGTQCVSQSFAYYPATGALEPLWGDVVAGPSSNGNSTSMRPSASSQASAPSLTPALPPSPAKRERSWWMWRREEACEDPAQQGPDSNATQFNVIPSANPSSAPMMTPSPTPTPTPTTSTGSPIPSATTSPSDPAVSGVSLYFTPSLGAEVYAIQDTATDPEDSGENDGDDESVADSSGQSSGANSTVILSSGDNPPLPPSNLTDPVTAVAGPGEAPQPAPAVANVTSMIPVPTGVPVVQVNVVTITSTSTVFVSRPAAPSSSVPPVSATPPAAPASPTPVAITFTVTPTPTWKPTPSSSMAPAYPMSSGSPTYEWMFNPDEDDSSGSK